MEYVDKFLAISVVCFFIVNGSWLVAEAENYKMHDIVETFYISNPVIKESSDGLLIKVKGTDTYLHIPGQPMLPVYIKTYTFPFGTKICDIDVSLSEKTTQVISKNIFSFPAPVTYIDGSRIVGKSIIFPDNTQNSYPGNLYKYNIGVGIKDDQHVIFVTIYCYPIQYISSTNTIVSYRKIDIHLNYILPEESISFPDEYDLLVIAPKEFSQTLQPLIDHKNSIGIKTKLIAVEDVFNGVYFPVEGRDSAEELKYFIKDSIENWDITYVLLIGGRSGGISNEKWLVPVRYSHLYDGGESSFLSDLYFADIYKYDNGEVVFEDWDSNHNDIFAEWKGLRKDILDLYPDVYLGRLPCKRIDEVKTMVDKIIKYENTAYDADWFKRMIVVGGDSAPGDTYYEGEEENAKALEYMEGFEAIKCWTSDGSFKGPEDVIAKINQGAGFLFFDGHGNPSTWGTHPPNDEKTWVTGLSNKDMDELNNGDKLPVTVVGGCHNGQFNVSLWNIPRDILRYGIRGYFFQPPYKFYYMEWVPSCWAWKLTSRPNGGAIATMAYAGLDWFATGDSDNDSIPDCTQYFSGFFNVNFFKNYGENNETILGHTFVHTLNDYINQLPPMDYNLDCKTVEEITLFGDPSLQIGGIPGS